MSPDERPWLARTGQEWRIWLVASLAALEALLCVPNLWASGALEEQLWDWAPWVALLGPIVVLIPGAWFAVRCASCGAGVWIHVMRTQPANVWARVLWESQTCPRCGAR